jgi:uncharacterized protein
MQNQISPIRGYKPLSNASCLYQGVVTHKRYRPVLHNLNYKVAAIFLNVDAIAQPLRLISYNRFNLFSIYDRDHGTGETISAFAWGLVKPKDLDNEVTQIHMLCYPRLLGFTFNPLTTYYCMDKAGNTRMLIFEVHNTFGGRHTYVSDMIAAGDAGYFKTDKIFYVSPFNKVEGHYNLSASKPEQNITVGVALTTPDGPTLNAYFAATRHELTDANLLRVFFAYPLMTIKVVAAIHYEALKLWLKGLKLQPNKSEK